MQRALIVGSNGQDGTILWDQLAARGHSLIGISRATVRVREAQWGDPVDITDPSQVRRLVGDFMPDRVYYLAAHHHSSQDAGTDEAQLWQESWDINLLAFTHLLRAIRDCSPATRVFHASSSRVFGATATGMQDETTPPRPECVYGLTKVAAMNLADYFRRNHGVYVSCGILFNHESPLRGRQFVSQRVAHGLVALQHGDAEVLEIGSLDARVDWGYAADYTRAMQAVLEVEEATDYVIASGETHSVGEMIGIASEYLGLDTEGRIVETARILRRDSQGLCGDASRLRQRTGWKPSVDFPQLVRLLVNAALEKRRLRSPVD